jgi:hypothetical protein
MMYEAKLLDGTICGDGPKPRAALAVLGACPFLKRTDPAAKANPE